MVFQYGLDGIRSAAAQLWNVVGSCNVIAFEGQMGAGKTTLIQSLCSVLEVSGKVSSPTFSIINEYQSGRGPVYHIDLYRCKNEEEAVRAGVEECFYSGNICFVEWPSKAPGIFPAAYNYVSVSTINATTRQLATSRIVDGKLSAVDPTVKS